MIPWHLTLEEYIVSGMNTILNTITNINTITLKLPYCSTETTLLNLTELYLNLV